ncbi:MAG TPA: hypothetical protein VIK24_10310 [Pyrinomonadaceae bacterium]
MRFQLLLVCLSLTAFLSLVQGQGRGVNAERARAIERAEMDRLLLWALPSNKESEATRLSRFKKIKDDFRDLQSLNNKMMADAWLQDALNYSAIAEMVSKIQGKANDLKKSLSLPEAEKSETALTIPTVTTGRHFREELLLLDKTIMGFVTNPVFQAANTLDLNQAKKASNDLEQVLTLTDDLKQNAQRLRKATP